jgi:hypothetical protein
VFSAEARRCGEKIIFCRKARKNAQIKNHNKAFLCALRVFCGKGYFKIASALIVT